LKGDVSPARVGELGRERGIDLKITPDIEQELRSAGATCVFRGNRSGLRREADQRSG
jgi:hypothetical protein